MKCSCSIGTKLSPVYKVICVSLLCWMYNVLDIKGVGRGAEGLFNLPLLEGHFHTKGFTDILPWFKKGGAKSFRPQISHSVPPCSYLGKTSNFPASNHKLFTKCHRTI